MSLAITHFALGATIAFVVSTHVDQRVAVPVEHSLVLVLGGIWAMLPDLNKLLWTPIPDGPILSNVFVFHGLLDVVDTADSMLLGVVAVALLLYVVVSHSVEEHGRK